MNNECGMTMNAAIFTQWNYLKANFHSQQGVGDDFLLFEHLFDIHEKFCNQCSKHERLPNAGGDDIARLKESLLPDRQRESVAKRDGRDRPRRNRDRDDDESISETSYRPNNRQQKDDLSPLRSPLSKECPFSDSHRNDHRHRDDDEIISENSYRQNHRVHRDDFRPSKSPLFKDNGPSGSDGSHRRDSLKKYRRYPRNGTRQSPGHIDRERNSYMAPSPPGLGSSRVLDFSHSGHRQSSSQGEFNSEQAGAWNLTNKEHQLIIARRKKNISYGQNTDSYKKYIATVPGNERDPDNVRHPRTPDIWQHCSRRVWDNQIKNWKKSLHSWANDNDTVSGLSSQSHHPLPTDSQFSWGKPAKINRNEYYSETDLNNADDAFF